MYIQIIKTKKILGKTTIVAAIFILSCVFIPKLQVFAVGIGGTQASGGSTLNSGLIGHWTFDGADLVSNVVDKSGNGRTGYMINMATSTAKVAGKLGQALQFDGVNDYVAVTTNPGNVKTISYWVKSNSQANGGIELNANQYIDDSAVPEGMVSPTLYVDGAVKTLYGNEIINNGSMEANSNWSCSVGTVCSQSSGIVYRGSYSWSVLSLSGFNGMYQSTSISANTMYKVSGWAYKSSGAVNPYLAAQSTSGTNFATASFSNTSGSWNFARAYGTSGATVPSPQVIGFSNNGSLTAYFDDLSLRPVLIRYPIDDTEWHHVVIVTDTAVSASDIKIGKGGASYLNGAVDEVRIYDRVLSLAEIRQLYNQGASKINAQTINAGGNTLRQGLIGHWTFDGADLVSNVTDKSGNGNHGYMVNMATSTAKVTGKLGQALKFDGVNDYVVLNSATSWTNSSQFTYSAWVKTDDSTRGVIIGDFSIFSAGNPAVSMEVSTTGKLRIFLFTGNITNYKDYSGGTTINNNKWNHLVVTYNNQTLQLFVNGVAESLTKTVDQPLSGSLSNSSPPRIGLDNRVSSPIPLLGLMDDVRMYSRALSLAEIKQLYNQSASKINAQTINAGGNTLRQGLIGHWTFDGADLVSNVTDKSGNGNHGYMVNMATSTAKVTGKLGQALKFDGSNDYVALSNPTNFNISKPVSVSMWVKSRNDSVNSIYAVGDKDATHGRTVISVGNGATGTLTNELITVSRSFPPSDTSYIVGYTTTNRNEIFNGGWHLITIVWDSSVSIYLDGQLKTATLGGGINDGVYGGHAGVDTALIGGGMYNGTVPYNPFTGSIDDVRVYNRALSASEVKQLYNTGR